MAEKRGHEAPGAAASCWGAAGADEITTPDGAAILASQGVDVNAWATDFTRHTAPLTEFFVGNPQRDGIPALDSPSFETVDEAGEWLEPREPVVEVVVGDDARAYPLQVVIWHEIVNDEIGRQPVSVTFCPLCNTALAFDRRLDDNVLDFGTSGMQASPSTHRGREVEV